MSEKAETSSNASPTPPPEPGVGVREPLPRLRTALTDAQIVERLTKASRRGKMAGFHGEAPRGVSGGDVLPVWFEVFGQYFDRRLIVRAERDSADRGAVAEDAASGGGSRVLRFENRVKTFRIWAFWVLTGLSVWPGVLLLHSMMATYFGWYPRAMWVTCAWYLPLTVLPVPWMWSTAWKKSAAVADAEARQSIARIAGHLGATVVEGA